MNQLELYNKVYNMNTIYGIWRYSPVIRITYVKRGWLVVWDHQQSPPTRFDCKNENHQDACASVVQIVHQIVAS